MRTLIIIPALNAERHLQELLNRINQFVPLCDVLVVDDGSDDQTNIIARDMHANVISNPRTLGKGIALRKGFDYALQNDYQAVITIDADLQHPPEFIPKFIEKARQADVIIGNRMGDTKGMPWDRKLTNYLTSLILSWITHIHIADSQCGYRLIKSDFLSKLDLHSKHYDLESEIIIELATSGAKFDWVELPVIYQEKSVSYINKFVDTIRFIKLVLWKLFSRR